MQITKILPLFASVAFAGGIMHNTNQSAEFVRNFAQDASISNSAVYYNPAGTAFAEDGLYASVNSQTVWQTREIETDVYGDYEGESFVPVMPSLLMNWHHGNLALSGGFFLIGGGGEAKFYDGLPMIDQLVSAMISAQAGANPDLTKHIAAAGISNTTDLFSTKFTGKQYVYAWQLGASYRFFDKFSAFLGARLNYAYNAYEGSMKSSIDSETLNALFTKTLLDCEQTGWGITPIASLGFHYKKFSAGIKYEHNTSIEMETQTEEIDATVASMMPQFTDGAKTDNDLPAILSVGVSYAWFDWLRTGVGYHHYFDTFASYANDKQDDLDGDENEFVFGIEADIVEQFTVSAGIQRTLYGITDDYISDLSFVTDSWSIGGGIAFRFTPKFQVQLGYMETIYEDYKKKESSGVTKTYDRTSHNIAAGLEFKL